MTVKELIISPLISREEAKAKGFPVYNNGEHQLVDFSNVQPGEMRTLSIKGPNNQDLTICYIGKSEGAMFDIKAHNAEKQQLMAFSKSRTEVIEFADFYNLATY